MRADGAPSGVAMASVIAFALDSSLALASANHVSKCANGSVRWTGASLRICVSSHASIRVATMQVLATEAIGSARS